MGDMLDHEWYCDRTETEIAAMAAATSGTDPAAPVPTCPEWNVARLIKHTGLVHRWVTEMVSSRATAPVDRQTLDIGLPASEASYPRWLAEGAAPLVTALRSAGPDAAVWSWGASPRSGFWARRMLHETTVHRADAQIAAGVEPDFDPAAAADGIDEFLAFLPALPRLRERLASLPAGQSVHLHATDSDGEWLIKFADGAMTSSRGHEKATAAVRGPVGLLLLFSYGRIASADPRLAVFGDAALLDAWQEKAAL
jgi:uncharacterized protein (TIGR03083 family)